MESFLIGIVIVHAVLAVWFAIGVSHSWASLEHLLLTEEVAAEEGIETSSTVYRKRECRLSIFLNLALIAACGLWITAWRLNAAQDVLAISGMIVPALFAVGTVRVWLDVRRCWK